MTMDPSSNDAERRHAPEADGRPFLRILVGATASGKERLALAAARALDAEVVSVDSMKIYRGLDIGTAKASKADRATVRHHAVDIAEPTEDFSAARFAAAADAAIADIATRGRRVILSGGTALYYKALLEGLFEGPGRDPMVRARWEAMAAAEGTGALVSALMERDPVAASRIHPGDTRRLVRALEINELTGRPISAMQTQWGDFFSTPDALDAASEEGTRERRTPRYRYRFSMVWLDWPRARLLERIDGRLARMRESGLMEEARGVWQARETMARAPLQAVAYKEFFDYFAGTENESSAWERLRRNTARLAKAQTTWFKRFPARRMVLTEEAPVEAVLSAWGDAE